MSEYKDEWSKLYREPEPGDDSATEDLAEASPSHERFAIGERVRITWIEHDGKEGVVTHDPDNFPSIFVLFDDDPKPKAGHPHDQYPAELNNFRWSISPYRHHVQRLNPQSTAQT